MKKTTKILLVIGVGIVLIYSFVQWFYLRYNSFTTSQNSLAPHVAYQNKDRFVYQGKNKKDALTLLKEKTPVDQSSSGLVVKINGRMADEKKREYWAFYVNKKLASVGPADYITTDEDVIEWKIEKY